MFEWKLLCTGVWEHVEMGTILPSHWMMPGTVGFWLQQSLLSVLAKGTGSFPCALLVCDRKKKTKGILC